MKKLMLLVILATICQFTFANTFDHGRGRGEGRGHGYGYHGGYHSCGPHGYCGPRGYWGPRAEIIVPRPCARVYINAAPPFWIEGHWIITPRGYDEWIPGHWSY